MNALLFATSLTLSLLFFFIAGFSEEYKGFRLALILGMIFLYLAFMSR
jgi:hypothetical protein